MLSSSLKRQLLRSGLLGAASLILQRFFGFLHLAFLSNVTIESKDENLNQLNQSYPFRREKTWRKAYVWSSDPQNRMQFNSSSLKK